MDTSTGKWTAPNTKNQGAKTTQIPVRYGDWPWLFTSTYSTITQQPGLLIVPSIKILRQAQKVFLKNGIQQSLNRANYEVGEVWNGLIWLLKGQFTKMHILTVPIWIDTTMPRERTCLKKKVHSVRPGPSGILCQHQHFPGALSSLVWATSRTANWANYLTAAVSGYSVNTLLLICCEYELNSWPIRLYTYIAPFLYFSRFWVNWPFNSSS